MKKPNGEGKPEGAVVLYQTEDGKTPTALFQTMTRNVMLHFKAIYVKNELNATPTCKDFLQVRREGLRQVSRHLGHYRIGVVKEYLTTVPKADGTSVIRDPRTTAKP